MTENTAPVLTLIPQFGGGKTHTLTALYHLATNGEAVGCYPGVTNLVTEAGVASVPKAKVAVFVGNAWDPREGREMPWINIARQLAGDKGVEALGPAAKTTAPGTEAIARVFQAAEAPVQLLFDEVLNFLNRHRTCADSFYALIENLTVATTGTTRGACVISLQRSQVKMTEWDQDWQDKISIDSAVSALEDRSFLVGTIPSKCGTTSARKYFPLRSGLELKIGLEFSVTVSANSANGLTTDLRQILQELGLAEPVKVE